MTCFKVFTFFTPSNLIQTQVESVRHHHSNRWFQRRVRHIQKRQIQCELKIADIIVKHVHGEPCVLYIISAPDRDSFFCFCFCRFRYGMSVVRTKFATCGDIITLVLRA